MWYVKDSVSDRIFSALKYVHPPIGADNQAAIIRTVSATK